MADQQWFFTKNKQKVGPISLTELRQKAVAGEILPADMVLAVGAAKWVQASSVDGLFPAPAPTFGPASTPTSTSTPTPAVRPTPPQNPSPANGVGVGVTIVIVLMIGMIVLTRGGRTNTDPAVAQVAKNTSESKPAAIKKSPKEVDNDPWARKQSPNSDPWADILRKDGDAGQGRNQGHPQDDPWEAVIRGAPGAPKREPMERLGWDRRRCMLCGVQRSNQDKAHFSDGDGFGFCGDCGSCANAYRVCSANFQQGFGSDPKVELMAKSYMTAVSNRYALYSVAFAMWGNEEKWRECWRNFAVLTAGPQSGR
jgi:hypothetical protein